MTLNDLIARVECRKSEKMKRNVVALGNRLRRSLCLSNPGNNYFSNAGPRCKKLKNVRL